MHNNKDQSVVAASPRRFWIIGAGRFGQIAVHRILHHIPGALLTVVDRIRPEPCLDCVTQVQADGVVWMKEMLSSSSAVDMILPAIPVHVAAGWIRLMLSGRYDIQPLPITAAWLAQLPHPMTGSLGQAYVSHADFICPDNCPEPPDRCTHTGKPRPMDLFRLLAQLQLDDVLPIVLRSHQLLPGVGGLLPADLFAALDIADQNHDRPQMIATACRCHGVVDFMRFRPRVPDVKGGGRFP